MGREFGRLRRAQRAVSGIARLREQRRPVDGTYSVTFSTPGTYQYDGAVRGTAMTGTIVVR